MEPTNSAATAATKIPTTTHVYPARLYTDASKASPSHRLSVIRWKATTANPRPHPTHCVEIPSLTLTCEPSILRDALTDAIHDLQDEIIRSILETQLSSVPPTPLEHRAIQASSLTAESVAAHAASKAIGDRLSKELLTAWFDSNIRDMLFLALAERNSVTVETITSDQEASLRASCDRASNAIASLAAPKPVPAGNLPQLRKILSLAPSGDRIAGRLVAKLDAQSKPAELLGELL